MSLAKVDFSIVSSIDVVSSSLSWQWDSGGCSLTPTWNIILKSIPTPTTISTNNWKNKEKLDFNHTVLVIINLTKFSFPVRLRCGSGKLNSCHYFIMFCDILRTLYIVWTLVRCRVSRRVSQSSKLCATLLNIAKFFKTLLCGCVAAAFISMTDSCFCWNRSRKLHYRIQEGELHMASVTRKGTFGIVQTKISHYTVLKTAICNQII